jgi:hypothetical protein
MLCHKWSRHMTLSIVQDIRVIRVYLTIIKYKGRFYRGHLSSGNFATSAIQRMIGFPKRDMLGWLGTLKLHDLVHAITQYSESVLSAQRSAPTGAQVTVRQLRLERTTRRGKRLSMLRLQVSFLLLFDLSFLLIYWFLSGLTDYVTTTQQPQNTTFDDGVATLDQAASWIAIRGRERQRAFHL